MMTAITTIGGMVPLALAGASSIGLSYTSFSITLIGGLSTATLLTLLVVPTVYAVLDSIVAWLLGSKVQVSQSSASAGALGELGGEEAR